MVFVPNCVNQTPSTGFSYQSLPCGWDLGFPRLGPIHGIFSMQASPLKLDPIHLAIFESAPSQKGEIGILFSWRRSPGQGFCPLFSSFAHDRPFWAVDARGHGASDRANGSYYIKDHAQDAIGVLEKITQSGTTPVVIFGHSMGALQAMAAATLRPDLVRGLILEDPPGPGFLATLETNPISICFWRCKGLPVVPCLPPNWPVNLPRSNCQEPPAPPPYG